MSLRMIPLPLVLALAACVREPVAEPPRSPDEPLILPSWAEAEPRSDALPKAARQRETITLGASDAPGGPAQARADAPTSSTQTKFQSRDTWGPYSPLYYRSMPSGYTTPGAGTSSPGRSQTPPIGRDWPAIPDHGPKFPFTTPVHP